MLRLDDWRRGVVLLAGLALALGAHAATTPDLEARLAKVLAATPLIDGHNDLPEQIRARFNNDLGRVDLSTDTAQLAPPPGLPPLMTDLPRLKRGRVGGQFWSVWVSPQLKGPEAVQQTLEQIDLVKRLTARYPAELGMAYSAADVRRLHREGRIASLIGVEGGHQINNSLAVLRQLYALGARYLTLTHSLNNDWADSATDAPAHHGLTPFGQALVGEMNRLGMLIDLSHVSVEVMQQALDLSAAPVIYSHSSARALDDHPRNVPDEVLRRVAANGGVVMVNFATDYVSTARYRWDADRAAERGRASSPPFGGLYIGQPARAAAALAAWEDSHPRPLVTLAEVADHIEHIRAIAGVEHVGLGSDFDGIPDTPRGLEGVDRFPALLAELMRRGWSDMEIAAVAGENLLRVLAAAEAVAARLTRERGAFEASIATLDGAPAAK